MSSENNVNIEGVVANINLRTNVYTPIIEAVVNSIDAIDESKRTDGEVVIHLKRNPQKELNFDSDSLPDITSIEIVDNGIGFNDKNTISFGTLYSSQKKTEGGKGFGRFMFLKYFKEVTVDSIFKSEDEGRLVRRTFSFGINNQMVATERVGGADNEKDTRTVVYLNELKSGNLDKKGSTIARKLLERLLIYFIDEKYQCPKIIIKEQGENDIVLNELLSGNYPEIQQIGDEHFALTNDTVTTEFRLKIFKIYYPDNQKSKVSLVAHRREVTETPIHNYVPEFIENFYDEFENESKKDYMIKTYVLGEYLDTNVSLERIEFNFPKRTPDALYSFSQDDIEKEASRLTKNLDLFKDEIKSREEKKREKIVEYINKEAPWHKDYLEDLDMSMIPYHLTDETIDVELYKTRLQQEKTAKTEIEKILGDPKADIDDEVQKLVGKISKANASELIHYIALRKYILSVFKKSLEIKDDGKYNSESSVHNIIFPTKSDSDETPYDKHNLWIIDERLNFTDFISSDQPLQGGKTERTDILIFNKKMAFRGANEQSNPITIFEFKKPQRDDFTNPSSKEDPIQQVIRYVNDIRAGKYKTPKGRDIEIAENTPFYGFVVCDMTQKVRDWLFSEKNFTTMPDGQGFFNWYQNNNLYIEVISWEKLLRDADMRNKIFFEKLGIN